MPDESNEVAGRSIGSIISETRHLGAEQVEKILKHQREKGIRFGEAAISLGYASTDDVMYALSQQFHYPYAAQSQRLANPELVALNKPFGVQAESFRAIRSQIICACSTRVSSAAQSPSSARTAVTARPSSQLTWP